MKNFDFYEFTGILVPGAITLYVGCLLFPCIATVLDAKNLSVGDFGMFVVLAYAAGHLVGAVGNAFECAYWKPWGGKPTDWVRDPKKNHFSNEQTRNLKKRIQQLLGLPEPKDPGAWPVRAWRGITRQIHAAVEQAGAAGRVYTFNGNYGMCRGLAASLLVCLAFAPFSGKVNGLGYTTFGISLALSIFRMHRFGVHYAHELLAQFLQADLPANRKEP